MSEDQIVEPCPRNSLGFLNFPPHLRHRIYTAANVLGSHRREFVNLNNRGKDDRRKYKPGLPRFQDDGQSMFSTTWALLLTCRAIYEELSEKIYESNHIFIRYTDFTDLQSLRRLSVPVIRAMKSLTIHLNVTYGEVDDPCTGPLLDPDSPRGLSLGDPAARKALEEWNQVWDETIRPNLVAPARLQLHFICDIRNFETGLIALRPFLKEKQPMLAGCSIRLSGVAGFHLNRLAKRAALKATASNQVLDHVLESNSRGCFRFFDLPVELQRHILSFTDLVAPCSEVEWNWESGMYYRSYQYTTLVLEIRNFDVDGEMFLKPRTDGKPARLDCHHLSHPGHRYCNHRHSAFSNMHCCRGWAPPAQMFLVSKAMRQLALEAFFSLNRFVFTPHGGITWECASTSPYALRFSTFLRHMFPREGLRYLRFLELVFPPFGEDGPVDYCAPTSGAWHDWVETLEYLKNELDLPKLTIRIYFASWLPKTIDETPTYRARMDSTQAEAVKKTYLDVILPMKRLRGLRRFFVHLPDPTEWVEGPYHRHEMRLHSLEEEAERIVMGHEYNAESAGKSGVAESTWSELHGKRRKMR